MCTPFLPTAALSVLFPLVLLGCGTPSERQAPGRAGGPPKATVALGQVRTGTLNTEWQLLGEVRSLLHAELAAGASGEVQRVEVREGDRVRERTLLVEIDPSVATAQLAATRAEADRAREEHKQAMRDAVRRSGAGRNVVAEAEIEQAGSRAAALEAETAQLSAEVREARAQLTRHRVVAPFAGIITERSVDPGDWVNPGDPVLVLLANDKVEVIVEAPPEAVDLISVGAEAELRRGARSVKATIRGIVRALDPTTRTVKMRLIPEDAASWLLPGATVDVALPITRREDGAVIVPRDALVVAPAETRVVRAVNGKADPVNVVVVATSANEALVRAEGLAPGTQVVIRGNERLRPGQPLRVAE